MEVIEGSNQIQQMLIAEYAFQEHARSEAEDAAAASIAEAQ